MAGLRVEGLWKLQEPAHVVAVNAYVVTKRALSPVGGPSFESSQVIVQVSARQCHTHLTQISDRSPLTCHIGYRSRTGGEHKDGARVNGLDAVQTDDIVSAGKRMRFHYEQSMLQLTIQAQLVRMYTDTHVEELAAPAAQESCPWRVYEKYTHHHSMLMLPLPRREASPASTRLGQRRRQSLPIPLGDIRHSTDNRS